MVAGDEAGCWRIVQDAQSAGASLDDVLLTLLGPALRIVGDRWEAGDIGVADEHQATVVAMRLIGRIGGSARRRGRPRGRVLLSAAPGDRHGLPSAMVTDLLRARGWVAIDLGADAPAEEIAATAARTHGLEAVGVCATTALDRRGERDLRRTVRLVRDATSAPIVLGGAAIADAAHATRLGADRWSATALDLVAALGTGHHLSPVGDA
jgi:methanogenic corrinoid protein MtbC1